MASELWPFADQFAEWHTSPPEIPLSFSRLSNAFHGARCPLRFEGNEKHLWQLFDPTSDPPYYVQQYPHLNLKDFLCWLQLPSDANGAKWFFGCVCFDQSQSRKQLFDDFRKLAAQAGACLRANPRFREWLWPCLQYLSQANRFPQLRDGEDIAWWAALLFTNPKVNKPLHAACKRSDPVDGIAFEIENPAHWSREAIRSWQLLAKPLWPPANSPVARTTRNISYSDDDHKPSSTPARKPGEDDNKFVFVVGSESVEVRGFGETVTMLERTPGIERLIAIVTSPNRRVAVMKLARIGAAQQASDRDAVDLDADGLTERESVNDDKFERRLGDDALPAAKAALGKLIAARDEAKQQGNDIEAKRLTAQINASLDWQRTELQKAAAFVRKSLDRTYERLRKDGRGKTLAKHFAKFVERPRQSAEFVYQPDESERKIVWNVE